MTTYTHIHTFEDDAYKSYIRENILNPMITQHNQMGDDLTETKSTVAELGSSVTILTDSSNCYKHDIADLEDRVFELEKAETGGAVNISFTDLADTPKLLECGKYLRVSDDGKTIVLADGSGVGGGIGNGDGGFYYGSDNVGQDVTAKVNHITCIDGVSQEVVLPVVARTLGRNNSVYAGRRIAIYNCNLDNVMVHAPVKMAGITDPNRQHVRYQHVEYHAFVIPSGFLSELISFENKDGLLGWQVISLTHGVTASVDSIPATVI